MNRTAYLILLLLFISKTSLGQPCVNGLQGSHTIGPTGQYPSLTIAFDSLRSKGVSGPVILELQNGYNSSVEIFPLKFTKIPCADSVKNIVIRPQVGATGLQIASNDPTATIDFNNGKFITIDGRSGGVGTTNTLTITNTNTAGSTIRFINDASWNNLKFLDIKGVTASSYSGVVYVGGTDSTTGNDFNRIDTCKIYKGSTNPANLVYAVGTIFKKNTGLSIIGCELFDYFSRNDFSHGIAIGYSNEKVTIAGNSIYQTTPKDYLNFTGSTNVYGIRVRGVSDGGHIIKGNFIGGTQRNAGGIKMRLTGVFNFNGISIYNDDGTGQASIVENNVITNIYFLTNSTGGDFSMLELGTESGGFTFNGDCINNTIGTMNGDSAIIFRSNTEGGFFNLNAIYAAAVSGFDSINIRLNKIGGTYIDTASKGNSQFWGIAIDAANNSFPFRCLVEGNIIGSPTVPNSLFNGGRYYSAGIILFGQPLQSNLIIRSNTICNITHGPSNRGSNGNIYGIWVTSALPGNVTITKNKIYNLKQAYASTQSNEPVTGVKTVYHGTQPAVYTISENEIYNFYTDNVSDAGGPYVKVLGIHLFEFASPGTFTAKVIRNYIHSLNAKSGFSIASEVIGVFNEQTANKADLENNMIRLGFDSTGNSIIGAVRFFGIYESGGSTNKYLHNTILIGGSPSSSNPGFFSSAFHSWATATTNKVIRNNIFVNLRGNSADTLARNYCIFILTSTVGQPAIDLDHNAYFFNSASGILGKWQGFESKTLPEWKAVTQWDVNSIFTNPNFVDSAGPASAHPIHIKSPTAIEGRGSTSFTTLQDFDGDIRINLSPVDIGADAGDFLQIEPGRAASNILTSNVVSTSAIVSVTSGDGERRLFVVRRDNAVTNVPVDGVGYNPNNSFGAGSNFGNNTFVVADTGSSVTINNLAAGATYHVRVFEFNGRNTSANYLTSSPATTSFTTQSVTAVIDLQSTEYSASVFPNPGKTFWISIQSRRATTAKVSVYSLGGELLFTESIPVNNGNNVRELEKIKKYPRGVYVLKMNIGKSNGTAKLVKF